MAMWILLDADGKVRAQVMTEGAATPTSDGLNEEGYTEVAVEAFGDLRSQTFDTATATWKARTDSVAMAAIDDAYRADNGALAIRLAHIQKAVEAQLIVAGIALPDSLVASEAEMAGVDALTLATQIVEKARADYHAELDRREKKRSLASHNG